MIERFEKHNIDSPRLISEMLLTHLFGGQRIDLYAHIDRIATDQERETLRTYVKRTLQHEPVQYIVGKAIFYGMEFEINDSTLIPRSCTHIIVDQALLHCKTNVPSVRIPRIADIGTGSGCIAITLASNLPECSITATDISKEVLKLAMKNAEKHNVSEYISFIHGDGTTPLSSLEPFDIICSNPPYIPDSEMDSLAPNVRKWEPDIALSGGSDGLQVVRSIIDTASAYLKPEGVLIIEIATSTRDLVLDLARASTSLRDTIILRDQHGDDRFLRAMKV